MPGDRPWPMLYGMELRGNEVFVHDGPAEVFGGTTTLHTGPASGTSLLRPVLPASA